VADDLGDEIRILFVNSQKTGLKDIWNGWATSFC